MSRRPSSSPPPAAGNATRISITQMSTPTIEAHQHLDVQLQRSKFLPALSLLTFVLTTVITSIYYHPNAAEVSDEYLTILTPFSPGIGAFWGAIATFLIISSSMMVNFKSARLETKVLLNQTMAGFRLPAINLFMSIWTIAWVKRDFMIAEIALSGAMLATASICWSLIKFDEAERNKSERVGRFVYSIITIPLKMMLIIMLSVDIWQNGLMASGYYQYIGPTAGETNGSRWDARDPAVHAAVATGIVLGIAVINSIIVFVYTDLTWAISTIYLSGVLGYQTRGKNGTLLSAISFGAISIFVSLLSSMGWKILQARRAQRNGVRLGEDNDGSGRTR